MPTKNRRVATYLPPKLDDRLKAFIEERGLKGDSPALIAILSEYFGVSHQVDRQVDYSGFVTKEEFLDLVEKVAVLANAIENRDTPGSILGKLPEKLRKIESRIDCLEATTEELEISVTPVVNDGPHPGQMSLLHSSTDLEGDSQEDKSELLQSSSSEKLQPMNGYSLSSRFGMSPQAVGNNKGNWWKNTPDKFIEWTAKKDPEGIAWRYNPEDKLYYPIIDSLPVSYLSSLV